MKFGYYFYYVMDTVYISTHEKNAKILTHYNDAT